jgi:hypothetical protein
MPVESLYGSPSPFQSQGYQVFGSGDLQVVARRLDGGLSAGVDVLDVTCGPTNLQIVPTRGMGVRQMVVDDLTIGWQSPVTGPVHPAYVDLGEPSGLGWLDGFDELLVRCGLESNGAPEFTPQGQLRYGLHGRIANRPAHEVTIAIDPTEGTIVITGSVSESRFLFKQLQLTSTYTLSRNRLGFALRDQVENRSQAAASCQLLYHINIGNPLLDQGSTLYAAAKQVVPRTPAAAAGIDDWTTMPAAQPGADEQVYFLEMHDQPDEATVVLASADGDRGLQLQYDHHSLPCFSFWKCPLPPGDGFVVGLEPATNFPNTKSYEQQQGRVIELAGGARFECGLQLDFLPTPSTVAAACRRVAAQQSTPPVVHRTPQPQWCEGA